MSIHEDAILSLVRRKMKSALNLKDVNEISQNGIQENQDIPYYNRLGKELLMDIFKPDFPKGIELPVLVNIHGGGLIDGNKRFSVGFCRQFAKRGYLVFSLEYRLIPDVRVYEQFDDVCAGMDCVGRKLVEYDVDLQGYILLRRVLVLTLPPMLLR